jgi:CDP-glycerol glycerophosphotransferase
LVKEAIKFLLSLLFIPVWYLLKLIPKKRELWIFGSWYGKKYSDNSRQLFEYINSNHPEIQCIWLTRDKSIVIRLRRSGYKSYRINSLNGIFYSIIACLNIMSSGKKDINQFFIAGSKTVQLWHGNPIKRICLDDNYSKVHSFYYSKIVKNLFPFQYEYNYDYVVSNADIFTDRMASAFGINRKNVLLTGCPRNDLFYQNENYLDNSIISAKYSNAKKIMFLPTFRDQADGLDLFGDYGFNLNDFISFLDKHDLIFLYKGHFADKNLMSMEMADSRIVNLIHIEDINFILKDADLLITDYSGAYFDFLLTLKPIIFSAFDLKNYISNCRELYFDYNDIVSGPVARNWDEVKFWIVELLRKDNYKQLRIEMNKRFNLYHDNKNSERLFNELIKRV